ncbi:hypothetical protein KUTeg_009085 [Tegillarca granosa]|uniref:C-type lectin domain-containing protein n=1 Tax=Tegillarca granosa TaxID=220873 RepID=A0ABQ9F7E3_TEGGR|nr:hypothetical protein KUTeg_009085 [Tegillarca granosa]
MGSIVGIAIVNSVCPEDWVEYQDTCLLFSKDAQSWDAAEVYISSFEKGFQFSTNQPTNKTTNQPTSFPTNTLTSKPTNQPTNKPDQPNQSSNQLTNQPNNLLPINQPTNQPTNEQTNQPPTNHTTGHCRLFGKAYLAAVETAEKMKFIENILRVLHLHWLGARDFIIEGSWRWLKTGFGLTYFNWGPNEPDDINGSQNCLKVLAFNDTIAWGDASCRDRQYYICEQA